VALTPGSPGWAWTTDYTQPVGRLRAQAPPAGLPLPPEGGLFRRFLDGFRY
jgi:hypothetical protein